MNRETREEEHLSQRESMSKGPEKENVRFVKEEQVARRKRGINKDQKTDIGGEKKCKAGNGKTWIVETK